LARLQRQGLKRSLACPRLSSNPLPARCQLRSARAHHMSIDLTFVRSFAIEKHEYSDQYIRSLQLSDASIGP
jgi:hypothetical protein